MGPFLSITHGSGKSSPVVLTCSYFEGHLPEAVLLWLKDCNVSRNERMTAARSSSTVSYSRKYILFVFIWFCAE